MTRRLILLSPLRANLQIVHCGQIYIEKERRPGTRPGTRQSLGLVFPCVELVLLDHVVQKDRLDTSSKRPMKTPYRNTRQDRKQDPYMDSDKIEKSKETFDSPSQKVV